MRPSALIALASLGLAAAAIVSIGAQGQQGFLESFEHPAIQYTAGPRSDAVSALIRKIDDGSTRLAFEPGTGYLRSVLKALDVPVDSQVAVFSQTSFQQSLIGFRTRVRSTSATRPRSAGCAAATWKSRCRIRGRGRFSTS